MSREMFSHFGCVWREDYALLDMSRERITRYLYVVRNVYARFVRKTIARGKPLSGKFYVFGPLGRCSSWLRSIYGVFWSGEGGGALGSLIWLDTLLLTSFTFYFLAD